MSKRVYLFNEGNAGMRNLLGHPERFHNFY